MDITNFTEFKTGQLEPIVTEKGKQTWAFIPNRLPSGVELTAAQWSDVAHAQQAVGSLEQIRAILPDPFLLLTPLQRREAIISSRLEGTYTLPEQMLLFDVEQEADAAQASASPRSSENREVWNHYEALRKGHNWLSASKPLDQSLILHLHETLMSGVRGEDKNPGKFRDCHVAVGRRPRRFIPPPPEKIESCVADLVEYMTNGETNGLIKSYEVHYQFEAIHPFQDGNGRVGRVLLSLCVSSWLGLSMPWLYMSEFFEKHKREYNERLFNISANGEWAEWFDFAMQGTVEQSQASIKRCERLRKLQDQYTKQVFQLGTRMRGIIDMVFVRPVIRIAQVAEKFGVSNEAARLDINKLVDVGILRALPRTRPRAFACFPIIDAAYGDDPPDQASDDASESEPPSSQSHAVAST